MKPRILFVLTSDLYVRNYITSRALNELASTSTLHFLVRDDVADRESVRAKVDNYAEYPYQKRREKRGRLIFDVLMVRYAALSQSFRFRKERMYPYFLTGMRRRNRPGRIINDNLRRLKIESLGHETLFQLFNKFVVQTTSVHEPLARAIDSLAPDLVIVPTAAYNLDAIDISKHCRTKNIKTLLLVDNWDNLSSKSILWERPDHVAVWGEQSKEHAITIQGFEPHQVSLIGTPRFDSYFADREKELPSHFAFPYALFVGTALPFDEANALRRLDEEIERNPQIYGDLKIVYRPHPWRQGRDSINGLTLKHVVLDPQMADNYAKRAKTLGFQPGLEYYPSLLKNAKFVLGGVSSMLIESMIFAKPYLVLAYDEGRNFQSPKLVLSSYVHFRGIERLPGIRFCRQLESLGQDFRSVTQANESPKYSEVDAIRQYYLFSDARPYGERLCDLVASLCTHPRVQVTARA